MQWSDIPWNPPARTLRQFAGLWILFFSLAAAWQGLLKGNLVTALILAGMAVTVGPLGLVKPALLRPIFVGWMIVAFPIGWVVSRVVLAILFYGIFTPVGLLFRLLRRDPLCRQPRPDQDTYWTPKVMADDPRSYFRQF